jgi:hypothetical protein
LEGPDVSYEDMLRFHKEGHYRIEVPTTQHLQIEFETHDTVFQCLADRKWQLLIADRGSFIASDRPIALIFNDGSPGTLQRPIGYGVLGTTVLLPINSELIAVGTFEGDYATRNVGRVTAAYMNGHIAAQAIDQIYSTTDSAEAMLGRQVVQLRAIPGELRKRNRSSRSSGSRALERSE